MQYISKALLTEYLEDTINKCETVINRSESIHKADDYLTSPTRMEKFDAACMLIQVIGETAKKIDTWTQSKLLTNYPNIYWRGIFGCRNIISHEYGNVDPEQIFRIIKIHLPELIDCLHQILKDVNIGKYDYLFSQPNAQK
jgi:uncharacterized protein with HEPN domain